MIQKRADEKITFPSIWANSCCSHPLYNNGEENGINGAKKAAIRKLEQELGIKEGKISPRELNFITKMHYKARADNKWIEHEVDYIFAVKADVQIEPNLNGKKAVIVGRSNLNGKPMTQLLLKENCTVTITHSRTKDLKAECLEADIIVAAVGIPELVKGDWVKKDSIIIDVGINKTDKGIVGDVAFDEVSKTVKKGSTLTAVVSKVDEAGIEVDCDGVKGFIKRSDLSRDRNEQRPDRFSEGDKVDAKVVNLDKSSRKNLMLIISIEKNLKLDGYGAVKGYIIHEDTKYDNVFTIHLDSKLSSKQMLSTLCHELSHLIQYAEGRHKTYTFNNTKYELWNGINY